jgi:hypothetical protein
MDRLQQEPAVVSIQQPDHHNRASSGRRRCFILQLAMSPNDGHQTPVACPCYFFFGFDLAAAFFAFFLAAW